MSFDLVRRISMVADREQDFGLSSSKLVLPAKKDKGAQGGGQSWVRIALADGSEALMTASHPMFTEGNFSNSGYTLGALKAEDLVPGVDSLISLCARPSVVKSVTPVPPEETPAGRIQVELGPLEQEDGGSTRSRRALLMTLPQEPGGPPVGNCFIGVCDSAVKPASTRFDALEEDGETASQTTKSGSIPSTGSGGGLEARIDAGGDEVEVILGSIDEPSGWRRSRADGEWYRCDKAEAARTVRLSDIRSLPRTEEGTLLSFGSIAHSMPNERCKVCVFSRKSGAICRHGWACTFCHAWHQPYVRPRRPDKRRTKTNALGDDESVMGDDRETGPPERSDRGQGSSQLGMGGNGVAGANVIHSHAVQQHNGAINNAPRGAISNAPSHGAMNTAPRGAINNAPQPGANSNASSNVEPEPWYVKPAGVGPGLSLTFTHPPRGGSMSSDSSLEGGRERTHSKRP